MDIDDARAYIPIIVDGNIVAGFLKYILVYVPALFTRHEASDLSKQSPCKEEIAIHAIDSRHSAKEATCATVFAWLTTNGLKLKT